VLGAPKDAFQIAPEKFVEMTAAGEVAAVVILDIPAKEELVTLIVIQTIKFV